MTSPSDPPAPRLAALMKHLATVLEVVEVCSRFEPEKGNTNVCVRCGVLQVQHVPIAEARAYLAILSADPPVPTPPAETLSDEEWEGIFDDLDSVATDLEGDGLPVDGEAVRARLEKLRRLSQAGPPPASGREE